MWKVRSDAFRLIFFDAHLFSRYKSDSLTLISPTTPCHHWRQGGSTAAKTFTAHWVHTSASLPDTASFNRVEFLVFPMRLYVNEHVFHQTVCFNESVFFSAIQSYFFDRLTYSLLFRRIVSSLMVAVGGCCAKDSWTIYRLQNKIARITVSMFVCFS